VKKKSNKNGCSHTQCRYEYLRNGKIVSYGVIRRSHHYCPITSKKSCKTHKSKSRNCHWKRCCVVYFRNGKTLRKKCQNRTMKCKKSFKSKCHVHKSANCLTKKCCKYTVGPNNTLRRRWWTCKSSRRCHKGNDQSRVKCKFIRQKNNCYKRKCCTTRLLNKKRVTHKCRVGQVQCRVIVRRKCRFISKDGCKRRYCCRSQYRDGKRVFRTCRSSINRICPTITKKSCKWKSINLRCKNKVCCTNRWKGKNRIFHNCFVERKKCDRAQKRTCWKRITKTIKRGKCIHRSCCIQRLVSKKLKVIRKNLSQKNKMHEKWS